MHHGIQRKAPSGKQGVGCRYLAGVLVSIILLLAGRAAWAQTPTPIPVATPTPTPVGCFRQVRALGTTFGVGGVEVLLRWNSGGVLGYVTYDLVDTRGTADDSDDLSVVGVRRCLVDLMPADIADLPVAVRAALRDWLKRRVRAAEGLAP